MRQRIILVIFITILLSSGGVFSTNLEMGEFKQETNSSQTLKNTNDSRSRGSIIVDQNGNGNYKTITDAVNNAENGDVIHVNPGIYDENNIVIDKSISLTADTSATTRIDPEDQHYEIIQIKANWVNISGFEIVGDSYSFHSGIYLQNVNNCTIENNSFTDNKYGIKLWSSISNIIRNNSYYENDRGIYIVSSNSNIIENNNCFQNDIFGLDIVLSKNNYIYNNFFDETGIQLDKSHHIQISNNTMIDCSLIIKGNMTHHLATHTIGTDNKVNDKPLYYWANVNGKTVPKTAGSVILTNCSNIIIIDLDVSYTDVGVQLSYSNNNTIENVRCYSLRDDPYGIYLYKSHDNIIKKNSWNSGVRSYYFEKSNRNLIVNNSCKGGTNGITLINSYKNIIDNNLCQNSYNGVYLCEADLNIISNNSFLENYYNIQLKSSNQNDILNNYCDLGTFSNIYLEMSNGNDVINNSCIRSKNFGIRTYKSNLSKISKNIFVKNPRGLNLISSGHNTIDNNMFRRNNNSLELGIISEYNNISNNIFWQNGNGLLNNNSASNNSYTNNLFYHNTNTGIIIQTDTFNNSFIMNTFENNYQQARDDGDNNWNSSNKTGNYWSDYRLRYPSATNNTYTWNTSYTINGLSGANDSYPLVKKTKNLPKNLGPIAIIKLISPNPGMKGYDVTFNGIGFDRDGMILSYIWRSDIDGVLSNELSFTSTSLSKGIHIISLKVQDNDGIWSKETIVTLNITEFIPKPPYDGPKIFHKRIYIKGNDEFNHENGIRWGNGSKSNPYIIEGWKISAKEHDGIYIKNTDAYFIIRNCNVTDENIDDYSEYDGIYFTNVTNGIIENSILNNNCNGIVFYDSSSNLITNNTCNYNIENGIDIDRSDSNFIFNNTCNNNGRYGVYHEGQSGLYINRGDNNEIIDNNCHNNLYGIQFGYSSTGNVIKRNKCNGNTEYGIFFYNLDSNFLLINNYIYGDNYANGRKIEWYSNENGTENNPIVIRDSIFSEDYMKSINIVNIFIFNCSYIQMENCSIENSLNGIALINSDNIEIISNYINNSRQKGIYLVNSNDTLISNNTLTNTSGIYLEKSNHNIISNNNCSECNYGAILTDECNYNIIENNLYSNNDNGIIIEYNGNNNQLINNHCISRSIGIYLLQTSNNSLISNTCNNNNAGIEINGNNNVSIIANNCSYNNDDGIILFGSSNIIVQNNSCSSNYGYGLRLHSYANNNKIVNNNVIFNSKEGIYLINSNFNNISNNQITNNSEYGIYLDSSSNNSIFHNNLINNSGGSSQGYDDQLTNRWDNGYPQGGNYWSDYKGKDEKSGPKQNYSSRDGIGDTPYNINGNSNKDNYPLIFPLTFELIDLESRNITIQLQLTKSHFYLDEPITGKLNVSNNNLFDIELNNQTFQHMTGRNFKILSKNNSDEFEGILNCKFPIEIKSKSYIIIDFELEKFVKLPTSGKEINYIDLDSGNYSMFAFFYYGNDSEFEEIKSNEVDFEIIAENRPDIVNLTVNIELTKTEFVVNELITGWINISNDNPFDVLIENNITTQRNHGEHLEINSLENLTVFRAIINGIKYPIKVKAQNFTTIEFKLDSVYELPIDSKDLNFKNLSAGNYSIFAFFYYGNLTDLIKIESHLVLFRITEDRSNQSGNITPLEPSPESIKNKSAGTLLYYSLIGLFVVILSIITIFTFGTEVGKFGFFSALSPLYTKRRKKKDENYGYIKGLVQGYINGNPGDSYNSIKRSLELNNGTLAYYLKVLLREEKIKTERDGMYRRFYPIKGKATKIIFDLSEIQEKIFNFIKSNPGSLQKDISSALEILQSKVNYHINLMVDARILKLERDGNKTKCFIIEEEPTQGA